MPGDSTELRLEIARKKERLVELRRAKAVRTETASQTAHIPATLYTTSRQEVEQLVESLIGPVREVPVARPPPLDVVGDFSGLGASPLLADAAAAGDQHPLEQQVPDGANGSAEGPPANGAAAGTAPAAESSADRQRDLAISTAATVAALTMSSVTHIEVPPQEKVMYSKEVQTDDMPSISWELPSPESPSPARRPTDPTLKRRSSELAMRRKSAEFAIARKASTDRDGRSPRDQSLRDSLDHIAIPEEETELATPGRLDLLLADAEFLIDIPPAAESYTPTLNPPPHAPIEYCLLDCARPHPISEPHIPVLSDQERAAIISSEDFLHFFDRSTKFIERALTEDYDILADYTATVDRVSDGKETSGMQHVRTFSHDKLTKNRSVTDIDWSVQFPELVLGSYNKNSANINDPDGLVLVWNMHLSGRPEFTLQAQSDVMSARFSQFHPHMIVGGTYSGQIVIWDTRAQHTPTLKTSLSSPGHSHPVFAMSIIGTQNAHNLVTASTDGVVCTWQLDMLAKPQELTELTYPSNSRTDEVAISCLAFPQNESTTFWVGTEEGNVYQANRFDRAGRLWRLGDNSKAGIDPSAVYSGHYGMITGIDFHPAAGSLDFQDLFLTSSVDWTVKLWKAPQTSKASTGLAAPQSNLVSCLHSFEEAEDYVFDVAWSPTHPAMFGSVDGSGHFNLFNMTVSEIPIASETVPNRKALNKISWNKDGKRAALASSDGSLFVYDVGNLCQARPEDTPRTSAVLKEFANEIAEQNRRF
ncbi:hypothetical protein HK105_203966 [Polyrhizophydium stewartii]|uniref:Uncharacterized protein n=1 Tax=Polyrhizophydium stewartii TaxID=2732419 RepID=A0ABR4NAJ7_9FUNG|nr:hypothetical protein HK105_006071 [Polyrhizophydium stewartii]